MEAEDRKTINPPTCGAHGRTLPPKAAELSTFHGPLPPWYRYDVGAADAEMTPRRAFEALVSAACYLAAYHGSGQEQDRDACALLKICARRLRDTVQEMRSAPEELEALIWRDKQIRWRRHSSMFVHREVPVPVRKTGAMKRWLRHWRGEPRMVGL